LKIGIIGSGNIGGNFGLHLTEAGHEVMFSSRHPEQLSGLVRQAGVRACSGTVEEASQYGQILVLSIPYMAIWHVAKKIANHAINKTVIDTCNPYPERDGEIALKVKNNPEKRETQLTLDSLPMSHIVKGLNTIYYKDLKNFAFRKSEERIALPLAGNDEWAKETVTRLLDDIGFDVVDIGTIGESRPMEVNQELFNKPMTASEIKAVLKIKN